MRLIFCSDPLSPREPDAAYEAEAKAAERLGIRCDLVSFEALVQEGPSDRAVCRVARAALEEVGVYRGWMLRPEQYARMYQALAQRGVRLVNSPEAYRHCHYLPDAYPIIAEHTARSVWLRTRGDVSPEALAELLRPFGDRPVIVKDFVKSRKHEWAEACFIPSAGDRAAVERVVRRFLELQAEYLNEGLVFREFVELEPLGQHPLSGMPLTREYRLFFLDGALLSRSRYWGEGEYGSVLPPGDLFLDVARRVRSRFFTMDVARRLDGEWMIVELGDGQVAGLPDGMDAEALYKALSARLP